MAKYPPEMRLPRRRYIMQLHNAKARGIGWELTFEQWWSIWQDSGRWQERGCHADNYCMCRIGDVGPYAVGNVFIATFRENLEAVDRSKNSSRTLPVGVRTQRGKFYATRCVRGTSYHIGTFPTPELARSAYENFTV